MAKDLKTIRVLNYSTHEEDCGIGKYQEDFVRLIAEYEDVQSDFYPTSPNIVKNLHGADLNSELSNFKNTLKKYDILHIQHEFGFYHGDGEGLKYITDIAQSLNKKIVITMHTAPSLVYHTVNRYGNTPRAYAGYYRRIMQRKKILKKRLIPLRSADVIITLNSHTTQELINIVGVDPRKIYQTVIPIEQNSFKPTSKAKLRHLIKAKDGDIILATIGFLSDKKGVDAAVKSLKFLPTKYKLAILGGINPVSGNPVVYDSLCNLIIDLNLEDRVYISGYIEDDNKLDELVSGADIALYPYNPEYYRIASSAAINTAINNSVPVISYPAESFKEINRSVPDTISITPSPNFYELVRAIRQTDFEKQEKSASIYKEKNNIIVISENLINLYRGLVN
jgi:glycosyltransferase involved in cell wall biosynthesis